MNARGGVLFLLRSRSVDPAQKREIEGAVGEALALYGVSGTVVLVGQQLELHSVGPAVSIDVELIGEQWGLLPDDIRARKAGDLARRLSEAHRASGGKGP